MKKRIRKMFAPMIIGMIILSVSMTVNAETSLTEGAPEIEVVDPVTITNEQDISEGEAYTRDQLVSEMVKGINLRKDKIEIIYYGDDITVTKEVSDLFRPIYRTGGYKAANIRAWGVSVGQRDGYKLIRFNPIYRTTEEEESFIDSEVSRISEKIIKEGMTDYEKVLEIHRYFVNNIKYTKNTIGQFANAHTLFNEGKGVCDAYTLAAYKLFDYNGIENYYVAGNTGEGLHAWNKVKLDGHWYNIDVTWSFPTSKYGLHNTYKYFLVSDKRFEKTHTPLYNHILPKANNSQYDGMYDNNFKGIVK